MIPESRLGIGPYQVEKTVGGLPAVAISNRVCGSDITKLDGRGFPGQSGNVSSEPSEAKFVGRFPTTLDESGRVLLPAGWRNVGEPGDFHFLIDWVTPLHPRLVVLPPGIWNRLAARLKSMPLDDPLVEPLKRVIGAITASGPADDQGWLEIPPEMARQAGLIEEVILVGLDDWFGIWSPEHYTAAVPFTTNANERLDRTLSGLL